MATNAISLNGTSQYGSVSPNALIDTITPGTATVEGWFWNDPTAGDYAQAATLANSDASVWASRLETDTPSGGSGVDFSWDYATTDADGYNTTGVFDTSTWVHIAAVYTLNAQTVIYKNGTEISYTARNTPAGAVTSQVGFYFVVGWDNDISSDYWKGKIGGFVRLWRRALSATEIKREMSNNLTSAHENGLIVNLKFTEGSGTTVANEAYAAYPCNLVATPSWTDGPTITEKNYYIRNLTFKKPSRPKPYTPGIAR